MAVTYSRQSNLKRENPTKTVRGRGIEIISATPELRISKPPTEDLRASPETEWWRVSGGGWGGGLRQSTAVLVGYERSVVGRVYRVND